MKNIIIIGPGRTGTTSVFQFLNGIDSVSCSNIKELFYFSKGIIKFGEEYTYCGRKYAEFFSDYSKTTVEASPAYFLGGKAIARRIKSELPEAVVVCILRDPVDRFYSLYKHVKSKVVFDESLTLKDFIERCKSISLEDIAQDSNALHYSAIIESEYDRLLLDWHEVFGIEKLKILDYDRLSEEGYASLIFDDVIESQSAEMNTVHSFGVTNQSNVYKYMVLQKFAQRINVYFEPLLNKFPKFKKFIKNKYLKVNASENSDMSISPEEREIIEQVLGLNCHKLYRMLESEGYEPPSWLVRKTNF